MDWRSNPSVRRGGPRPGGRSNTARRNCHLKKNTSTHHQKVLVAHSPRAVCAVVAVARESTTNTVLSRWYLLRACVYGVCIHACVHACMYACMYAYMHVCMCACVHAYLHVCMYVCMHAYLHVCMCACVHVCMFCHERESIAFLFSP